MRSIAVSLLLVGLPSLASAADWPAWRGNAARSGYTAESLPEKLSLAWTYRPAHPPAPAWPRDDRMTFDRAFDVAVAGSLVFFGSSADGRVVALDAATGRERWTFFTDAPVRFAPAVWKDRLFVVSDDGYLYCLATADGRLIQKWRGGPSDEMILGNGRMVSRWPARGGPVIRDDIVYWAAGVWQSDGIFVQAIDAASGQVVWRNDDAGKIYMPQPHGGANAESGVSPQGYLVATEDMLLVPTGRAVPAAFSRQDGRFLYYHLQANGRAGGTQTVALNSSFANSGRLYQLKTGALEGKLAAGPLAALAENMAHGTTSDVRVVHLVEKMAPDRKGVPTKSREYATLWSVAEVDGSAELIGAGDKIVAGGAEAVTVIDARARKAVWSASVDGPAFGLAVAEGRLFACTNRGTIYAFDGGDHAKPAVVSPANRADSSDNLFTAAAAEILRQTGVKEGYCLDLDCGDGSLALALARKSKLQIYALSPSADEVETARRKLNEAGVYGVQVTVHQGDASSPRYGKYFADLVVSSRSLREGPLEVSAENPPAALRPFGGMLCTGTPGAMKLVTRGALPNTGHWTHQYSDLGNTGCSTDSVVKGQLHALWFRDVDLALPQRHGRGPAPLFHEGRMFVEGLDALRAVDAYNGRNLWEFKLPGVLTAYNADHLSGTAVTGSNFCVAGGAVFVHDKSRCYRLDAATGRKLAEFAVPPQRDGQPGQWGYIACDGKLLYGSLANANHRVRYAYSRSNMSTLLGESTALFALDAVTGELRWRYDAQQSIRHNAIAIGAGRVYLIDRPVAAEDQWDGKVPLAKVSPTATVNQPAGRLVALDAASGKTLWNTDRDIFGTMLAYQAEHDSLLMCYQSTRFKLPSEVGGRLAVHAGETGERLWEKTAKYVTRPLINGRTIYAQGGAWDLVTGEDQPFDFTRSYGCGQLAGSKHMLLYRSATLGYFDLTRGSGSEDFGGIRPGCWINALPVGGLVLVPDASAGCQCSYQNRSWLALEGE